MKLQRIALKNIAILFCIALVFTACEEEFATIDSDIINQDTATNFDVTSEKFEVISYTNVLDPVQTNGLGLQQLGYFKGLYGETTASVVTQVNTPLLDPTFGQEGTDDGMVLDSVVLTIPYFSTNQGLNEAGDGFEFSLDSVFPRNDSYQPIKLSIFENNYFLRDFDPNGEFDDIQRYYSDGSVSTNETIAQSNLESFPIAVIDPLPITADEVVLTNGEEIEEDVVVTERLAPRIRQTWTNSAPADASVIQYWKTKILDQEGNDVLRNSNNFNNYFRGLYFKAEPFDMNNTGSLMLLNFGDTNANVTLYFSFDSTNENDEDGREQSTYTLTFGPNVVNLIENQNNTTFPTSDGDAINGDEQLFLKGSQGSVANIDLTFNSTTNSLINNFDDFKEAFANYDDDGEFESFNRLINEANLVFYVDQDALNGTMLTNEPDRLYLYNRTNGIPLTDYFLDSQNSSLPQISVANHLGILERDEDENGVKYKMRITQHIINLLTISETENVGLGLAISGNVNLEASVPNYDVLNPLDEYETVPVSTIINPRSTILHGNASTVPGKKLELEIFYTEISN